MFEKIGIGMLLIIATTIIHAAAMSILLWQLRAIHAERWGMRSQLTRLTIVATAVLFLFVASLFEVSAWAVTYLAVGALSDSEAAFYFSMVTYTSLGYGDVVLTKGWRLLGSFEAANGIVMFGWTTALIFFIVQRLYLPQKE